jgi:type I restriction enzyme, S subunit
LKSGVDKITYHATNALAAKARQVAEALSDRRQELDRLIALLGDRKTEELEIVATLFAAWNDALLDGQSPSDDWIIHEVRENWHVKKQRFTAEKLGHWLDWMRKHHLVPTGKPPRTQQQVKMFQ